MHSLIVILCLAFLDMVKRQHDARVLIRSYGDPNSAGRCSMAHVIRLGSDWRKVRNLNGPVLLIGSSCTECWQLKST